MGIMLAWFKLVFLFCCVRSIQFKKKRNERALMRAIWKIPFLLCRGISTAGQGGNVYILVAI